MEPIKASENNQLNFTYDIIKLKIFKIYKFT